MSKNLKNSLQMTDFLIRLKSLKNDKSKKNFKENFVIHFF